MTDEEVHEIEDAPVDNPPPDEGDVGQVEPPKPEGE